MSKPPKKKDIDGMRRIHGTGRETCIAYGHNECDAEWRKWIDEADIEGVLPPQEITPIDMKTTAQSIRRLLKGEDV